MEQVPLLQTKLYISPARREVVSRPRLIERLNVGLDGRLVLISAPAGFGKTTLLSEWLDTLRTETGLERRPTISAAWFSLDEGDNDPTGFLSYLVTALRTVDASIGRGALSALRSPQPPPPKALLTTLINEIAARPERFVLILDDYHLIEAQSIHEVVIFLLEHLPPSMCLVIACRDDPPLSQARLRARGQLIELRATELRFSIAEAAEFLNQVMGLDLSPEDVTALEWRTEGWIAGLQLAALAIQGAVSTHGHQDMPSLIESFTGSHRYVLDYLLEEVLDHQSKDVQQFLLETSILNRLSASLCDAVRSEGTIVDGQAILEMLERAGLFLVPLDAERCWYRYHHLFADLLRQRLRQIMPGSLPALHRRASRWFEKSGFVDEAVDHALRAGDLERAAFLVDQHVDLIYRRGEHTKLKIWLARLPVELVHSKPDLCILSAWQLFVSGQQDAAEQRLQAAEKALDTGRNGTSEALPTQGDQVPFPKGRRIRGRAATIRAFLASYWGDVPGAIQYARRALETLPEQDLIWRSTATVALSDALSFLGQLEAAVQARWDALETSKRAGNLYMALITCMKLAVALRGQGHLQQAIEMCQQHVQLAEERGWSQTPVVGCLLAVWGEVLAEVDDLNGALERAKTGVDLAEQGSDLAMIGWSNLCLTMVLYARGDLEGAGRIIQKMQGIARERNLATFVAKPLAAWQARIWLAQGQLDAAGQWLGDHRLEAEGDLTFLQELDYVELSEYLGLARVLLAQGRSEEATALLQRLLARSEVLGHASRTIQILVLQALVFEGDSKSSRAMAALEQALVIAEPSGYVRTFVNEGPAMARLLCTAANREVAPDYARRLLAAFPSDGPKQTGKPRPQTPICKIFESLSERELEVLRLIAEGLTNREVATRLFLTVNTVKAHTRNIYGKLGVHSRMQAVARARALGILSAN